MTVDFLLSLFVRWEILEAVFSPPVAELADLEKWIRAQFGVYIKSLLLTAEGRGELLIVSQCIYRKLQGYSCVFFCR